MYEFFPGNYLWSYNVWVVMAAGGQIGDFSLIHQRLLDNVGDVDVWSREWSGLAETLEKRGEDRLSAGTGVSASEAYFLATMYHKISEHFIPPEDPKRQDSYAKVLASFETARAQSRHRIDRVEVPYEGATLPAYFIPAENTSKPCPTAIFICGLDTTKEMTYLRTRQEFAARGINLLAIDTPGVGEALRLGGLATRFDYEVPVAAAIDYLETRDDVDPDRIGIIGSSLGGYYVARAAAYEKRLRAVVAWGAQYDYHAVWHRRMTVGGASGAPGFQLMYITGTETMGDALAHIEEFKVEPLGDRITCPILVVHGAEDQQVFVEDAEKMFGVLGSDDKTLKYFSAEEGGAAHCQFDNHLPALLYVADWIEKRLTAA